MKYAVNLAWLAVGAADVALGYFCLWQWAAWPAGGIVFMLIGAAVAADAVSKLRKRGRVWKIAT